jgi:hypothetical protein
VRDGLIIVKCDSSHLQRSRLVYHVASAMSDQLSDHGCSQDIGGAAIECAEIQNIKTGG